MVYIILSYIAILVFFLMFNHGAHMYDDDYEFDEFNYEDKREAI